MDKKISIIVPIYNVEQFLDKCVASIINQTYRNLEIILVDDGSPDNCGKLCDEWAKKDDRIKVIHKENGGLSDARNAGVEIASGDYIGFVDSDDYIESQMYEKLVNIVENGNVDIAFCDNDYVTSSGDILSSGHEGIFEGAFEGEEIMRVVSFGNPYYITAVNKIYRTELAKSIKFPKGKWHEDEFTTHHFITNCNRIACTREVLYHYVKHEGSITQSGFSEKRLDAIDALLDRYEHFKALGYKGHANHTIIMAYGKIVNYIKDASFPEHKKIFKLKIKEIRKALLRVSALRYLKLYILYLRKSMRV